mgnify:CR=1 FL=1
MVKSYYLNKQEQPEGEHEVHASDCKYFPAKKNAEYLGEFEDSLPAVVLASHLHPNWSVNGCRHCCRESDTD